jgi:hypothetical protein
MKMLNGTPSRSAGLLEAIKPHLAEKRRTKIDRAMQLARMAKAAQIVFKKRGGGDSGTV